MGYYLVWWWKEWLMRTVYNVGCKLGSLSYGILIFNPIGCSRLCFCFFIICPPGSFWSTKSLDSFRILTNIGAPRIAFRLHSSYERINFWNKYLEPFSSFLFFSFFLSFFLLPLFFFFWWLNVYFHVITN